MQKLRTPTVLLIGFLLLLAAVKALLWLHLPLPTTDGIQMLSHTFSVLRGDWLHNTYWHNWMTLYQFPYGYTLFTAPLMGLLPFGRLNNYFAIELIFAAVTALLAYRLIAASTTAHAKTFAALAGAAVFTHPQMWTMRPESITVPLLIAALILVRRSPNRATLVGVALLTTLTGLTHPIGGIIGVIVITFAALENRWSFRRISACWALIGAWLAVLYLPLILLDVPLWIENFIGFFTREEPRGLSGLRNATGTVVRAAGWSAPLIALYGLGALRSLRQPGFSPLRELIIVLALFVPILFGGMGGSYFAYLILFMLWRLSLMPRLTPLPLPIKAAFVLIVPFFAFYMPTLQNVENPRYGETIRAIFQYTDSYSARTDSGLIWVSTQAGYPIADEPYARVLANYIELNRYDAPIPLNPGDEVLFIWESERSMMMRNYAVEDARVEMVIEPVPGLLTVESGLQARLPDVGLWRVTNP